MVDFCLLVETQVLYVHGDGEDLETMFIYLLQNSMETADPEEPLIRIWSRPWQREASFVEVEIFNTGKPPEPEEMDHLFVPFYSSKPYGTGFGLPIAQLAARKNLGDIYLEP
ncbi:MAG: ATP-binding protein, partial [Thermodesulfobacteriota bacterium]|nr:ATP-binding protein [Thermodesulfobacteriota bacterium]